MNKQKRDYLQDEILLKEQVGVLHTDLYAFTKKYIMNMNVEQSATQALVSVILKEYAVHTKNLDLVKNKDVRAAIQAVVEFNDERFSLNANTFFELQETNPYYLINLKALNIQYEFVDKPAKLQGMTPYEIFEIFTNLHQKYGTIKKKMLIDYCKDLQTNGAKSTDWK